MYWVNTVASKAAVIHTLLSLDILNTITYYVHYILNTITYYVHVHYILNTAMKKSLSARDAGSLTSRVNGSVMARLVVPIQAILYPLQGN